MKKISIAMVIVGATALATPAFAVECISDLNKAKAFVQSTSLDHGTRRHAERLIGDAMVYKLDGKFELCDAAVRDVFHILGIE